MNVAHIARIGSLTFRLVSATSATNHYPRCRSSRCVKFSDPIQSVLNQNLRTLPLSFVQWYHEISAICLRTLVGKIPPSIGDDIRLCPEIRRPGSDISRLC